MKKLLVYDQSEKSFVGFTWKVGAFLTKWFFDKTIGLESWEQAEEEFSLLSDKYDHMQFWGHGSPGFIYVDGSPAPTEFWLSLGKIIKPNGSIWLRVCSFAASAIGKTIMSQLAKTLKCNIYAHTYIIGSWASQSGLRKVGPNDPANWSSMEGIELVDGEKVLVESRPWYPNTVSALRLNLPEE